MPLPTTDTVVSYPSGATTGTATVLHAESLDSGQIAVLLDTTPCHPVDAGWPDQGPDRATLSWDQIVADVVDCVVAATDGTSLYLGSEVPARKGTEGWAFVVAHLVEVAPPEGTEVTVTVDADHRRALSIGHTACHLAALALNRALADRWSKEASADALGSPDFDQAANATSTIVPGGSFDTYRLNKSLRRKGFITDGFAATLPAVTDAVNAQLASWVAADSPVRIARDGEHLTDRRSWVCSLPDGEATIPCGGTHASSLGELGKLEVTLELDDVEGTPVLTMRGGVAD
ncbi:MAG: metal-dependent hydrolase [Homoserinimonas sp.]